MVHIMMCRWAETHPRIRKTSDLHAFGRSKSPSRNLSPTRRSGGANGSSNKLSAMAIDNNKRASCLDGTPSDGFVKGSVVGDARGALNAKTGGVLQAAPALDWKGGGIYSDRGNQWASIDNPSRAGKAKPLDAAAAPDRYARMAADVPRGSFFSLEQPCGGAKWHALLWHSATNGVDQCLLLHGALSARCPGAQLCLRVTDGAELTEAEVRQTVEPSAALVILLTRGVLARRDTQVPSCDAAIGHESFHYCVLYK